jgi:dienelactone hydrolase
MHQETLIYQADGLTMHSQLFFEPGEGRRAGVIVFPEAFGLGHHAISRARRLAEDGYIALASDLWGEGKQIEDMQAMMAELGPLAASPQRIRDRANAALAALVARPEVDPARIAAIGFCLGGTISLELARGGADIKAVVGFHSGLSTKAPKTDAKNIKARVLMCIGADDPMITAEQRAEFETEMREAGVDWQLHLYGNTVHGFTNKEADARNMPHALRYSADADARSWASLQELFEETLAA